MSNTLISPARALNGYLKSLEDGATWQICVFYEGRLVMLVTYDLYQHQWLMTRYEVSPLQLDAGTSTHSAQFVVRQGLIPKSSGQAPEKDE